MANTNIALYRILKSIIAFLEYLSDITPARGLNNNEGSIKKKRIFAISEPAFGAKLITHAIRAI
jgi:hypothetical protein